MQALCCGPVCYALGTPFDTSGISENDMSVVLPHQLLPSAAFLQQAPPGIWFFLVLGPKGKKQTTLHQTNRKNPMKKGE